MMTIELELDLQAARYNESDVELLAEDILYELGIELDHIGEIPEPFLKLAKEIINEHKP